VLRASAVAVLIFWSAFGAFLGVGQVTVHR
jgi:hypothetical protein